MVAANTDIISAGLDPRNDHTPKHTTTSTNTILSNDVHPHLPWKTRIMVTVVAPVAYSAGTYGFPLS